jgi:hypothetical protein
MSDFSSVRVLQFSRKKDKGPIWSEKYLAKTKRSGFKDLLLGKVNIPKSDEEINERTEEGKVLMENADLNEMAYTELILLIDIRSSSGKDVFSIIKECKSREYTDGISELSWDKLKKNLILFLNLH